ncbi:hypothetical protein IH992_17715 [Candidatus Poribacteria bacterium]|nr:hypothetical protein [Candidatus Poribacteria bacterium]
MMKKRRAYSPRQLKIRMETRIFVDTREWIREEAVRQGKSENLIVNEVLEQHKEYQSENSRSLSRPPS